MAKQSKKYSSQAVDNKTDNASKLKQVHTLHHWKVHHQSEQSQIEAYIEIMGEWAVIADIKSINHVAIADFIASLVNAHNQKLNLFEEAIHALELCLESGELTWESEQAADSVVTRMKRYQS